MNRSMVGSHLERTLLIMEESTLHLKSVKMTRAVEIFLRWSCEQSHTHTIELTQSDVYDITII